jgi:hypothetical protein
MSRALRPPLLLPHDNRTPIRTSIYDLASDSSPMTPRGRDVVPVGIVASRVFEPHHLISLAHQFLIVEETVEPDLGDVLSLDLVGQL